MSQGIYNILRKRYPEKEYALLSEVRDKAGFSASRSADYVFMNLWPSRGLTLNGIELKSHRSDWLSELKKPEKAENIFQYCDHFWLLTANDTVAKAEEIPATWGWMCVKNDKITVLKEAPTLQPKPISRHFLAALLKRSTSKEGWIHESDIADKIEENKKRAEESADRKHKYSIDYAKNLEERLKAFKESSGIDLSRDGSYFDGIYFAGDPKKIGEAVRLLMTGADKVLLADLLRLETTAKTIHEKIAKSITALQTTAAV
jgi:hypothetical protein